jgi:Helix-hairpin-helix domain
MSPQPERSTEEVLAGLVERVTFHNAENGFCVLRARARGHRDVVTVVGHAASISAGEWITASGDWVNDRTHGQQFKARFLRTSPPNSADGIEKYLASGMIRGVGPVYAKKLVRAFGEKVFDIIETTPDRLREIDGIGPVRVACLCGDHSQESGIGIPRSHHPSAHSTLRHAAAEPALHRRNQRQAAGCDGRAKEGRCDRSAQRIRSAALVKAGGTAKYPKSRSVDSMTPEDAIALAKAVQSLEHPGFAARLANMAGKPIELIGGALPATVQQSISTATTKALHAALKVALRNPVRLMRRPGCMRVPLRGRLAPALCENGLPKHLFQFCAIATYSGELSRSETSSPSIS